MKKWRDAENGARSRRQEERQKMAGSTPSLTLTGAQPVGNAPPAATGGKKPQLRILWRISLAHFLNDMFTSVVPALLPLVQKLLGLAYVQVGVVVMVANVTSSLLQPVVGAWTDRRPLPQLMPVAFLVTGAGLVALAVTESYGELLAAVALIGIGSAVFHPESSRVAHLAAGTRKGLAQAIFQVGGNAGQAVGPLLVPLLFLPFGLYGGFGLAAVTAFGAAVLVPVARWMRMRSPQRAEGTAAASPRAAYGALALLVAVVTMRSWIHSGVASFAPLYQVDVLNVSLSEAEVNLFLFLFAGALGTFLGGPLSDRIGRKNVVLTSMIGAVPFLLLLPYTTGAWTSFVLFLLGLVSLCSFAVTVVYAQQLVPGRVGMVSGLMIGLAIGAGGIGSALLGVVADRWGLDALLRGMVLLPLIGFLLALPLPDDRRLER